MSGGSYDYAFRKVEDMAGMLTSKKHSPLRRVFAEHLKLVAEAMQAIEWVDSADYSPGDEDEPIKKALGENAKSLEIAILTQDAKDILSKLQACLEPIKKEELCAPQEKTGEVKI